MPLLHYIPGVLTGTAVCFYLANFLALRSWQKQPFPPVREFPVSILKPLKGADRDMYAALRSHCEQRYSAPYEIIFGVNSANDDAVPYVERLQREYPRRSISLVVCETPLGANRKVSNLVQMAKSASYSHLIVNDSDITVPADYLRDVLRWFSQPGTGMVTCLYRAKPGRSIWSRLEALGVVLDFMPGALTARWLEGKVRFGLGSTMAVSREALDRSGGFEPLVDFLADDYELANQIVRAGYQVVVANVVVETHVQDYRLPDFWHHQLRWGRTVRSSRYGGYLGLVVTFGLFWALAWLLSSPGSVIAWAGMAAVLGLRWMLLTTYARALEDTITPRAWWLVPLRDLLSPLIWLFSILGHTVLWRGETFRLRKGKLSR